MRATSTARGKSDREYAVAMEVGLSATKFSHTASESAVSEP